MRKNKKIRKDAHFKAGSANLVGAIVLGFMGLMIYWSQDSRVSALLQEIGDGEKKLAALQSELDRETARWEEMKTPEKLENQLVRMGLDMRYTHPQQVVRMNARGVPAAGQMAVARNGGQSRDRMAKIERTPLRKRNVVKK